MVRLILLPKISYSTYLRREGSDPVTVLKATFIFACRDSVQKLDEESCVVIEEEEEDYRVLVKVELCMC